MLEGPLYKYIQTALFFKVDHNDSSRAWFGYDARLACDF